MFIFFNTLSIDQVATSALLFTFQDRKERLVLDSSLDT